MTKKIKEGVEVSWICPDCRIRNFTSDFLDMEPSIAEQPIADHEEPIADQHADHEEPIADQHADREEPIADQHTDREEPITDQPDMDFDVNRTIDDSVHPMEPSLQEEQITSIITLRSPSIYWRKLSKCRTKECPIIKTLVGHA